jgi:hypothetical protein
MLLYLYVANLSDLVASFSRQADEDPGSLVVFAATERTDEMFLRSMLFGVPFRIAAITVLALCTGCSVAVHIGSGSTIGEQKYRQALAKPFNNLTAAASAANSACAGGSEPDPRQCYIDTNAEIGNVGALEHTLESVAVPASFARANSDLLRGLRVFSQGLVERNRGLAAHSAAGYTAGENLVIKGLNLQKSALREYPAGAKIGQ